MASQTEDLSSKMKKARQSVEEDFEGKKPKIQTVSLCLQEDKKYAEYYKPKLISIGPIHHSKYERGEQYKLTWTAMFVEQNKKDLEVLYKKILDRITSLRKLFSWADINPKIGANDDKDLATMLLVDGCSVLQILRKGNLSRPEELKVKVDQLVLVQRDLLLLENQLPYEVLKLLVEDEMVLRAHMYSFCELQNMFAPTLSGSQQNPRFEDHKNLMNTLYSEQPIHLLDFLHKIILSHGQQRDDHWETQHEETLLQKLIARATVIGKYYGEPIRAINLVSAAQTYEQMKDNQCKIYRTITELKASAIRMKRQEISSLRNIKFSSSLWGGRLYLPPLILDDSTAPTLLNLVAYEMCPDFKNKFEISSYVKLLDVLIDYPEDVKELRNAGILHNAMKNDEEVSELFNTISSGLIHNPSLYSGIREEMEKHYKKTLTVKCSIWIAEVYRIYFKSPWSIISLVAATILLVLTSIQTWKAL